MKASAQAEVEKRYTKTKIGFNKLVEITLIKNLSEKAGVLSRSEWIEKEKDKIFKTG